MCDSIFKHQEESWKSIFHKPWGVWKGGQTQLKSVWQISSQIEIKTKQWNEIIKSYAN